LTIAGFWGEIQKKKQEGLKKLGVERPLAKRASKNLGPIKAGEGEKTATVVKKPRGVSAVKGILMSS